MYKKFLPALVAFAVLACAFAASASAEITCETCTPWWHLNSSSRPTNLHYFNAGTTPFMPGLDEVQDIVATEASLFGLQVAGQRLESEGRNYFQSYPYVDGHFPHLTRGEQSRKRHWKWRVRGAQCRSDRRILEDLRVCSLRARCALRRKNSGTTPGNRGSGSGRSDDKSRTTPQAGNPAHPNQEGRVVATVLNVGDATTTGEATIVDTLPQGLKAVEVEGAIGTGSEPGPLTHPCSLQNPVNGEAQSVVCSSLEGVLPYQLVEVRVGVVVEPGAVTGEENEISVTGGGAPSASIKRPLTISPEPTKFGVEDYELTPENEGGAVDTQAGSHPFQTTFTIAQNQE